MTRPRGWIIGPVGVYLLGRSVQQIVVDPRTATADTGRSASSLIGIMVLITVSVQLVRRIRMARRQRPSRPHPTGPRERPSHP
jgi:hypothetical protein